jgi:hypothetical protein
VPVSAPARRAVLLLGPAAVLAAMFVVVRPTNFGGHDEWLVLSLASRGIVSFPYAHRPLALLWALPGTVLARHDLMGYLAVHFLYLAASGALVALIARRYLRLPPAVALVAGVLTATWAPLDEMRLDVVLLTGYSGFTAATLAAMLLFLEGWRGGRAALGLAGAAVAVALAYGFEGTAPLLAAAPLAALASEPGAFSDPLRRRRFLAWSALWLGAVTAALVPLLWWLARGEGYRYQAALGPDFHPRRMAWRLVQQYGFHLFPAVTTPPAELMAGSVLLAVAVFAACFVLADAGSGEPDAPRSRSKRAMVLGVAMAGLGWLPLVTSPLVRTAARAQVLSAPGVAVFLAAALALAASLLGARWRRLAVAAAAGWLVAVGAGRTAALQRQWDAGSFWPAQRGTLAQLTRLAPRLAPNTLVILVDEAAAWRANFTFRHAIHYLYGPDVVGHAWGSHEFLYAARFAADGVHATPDESIRGAWETPATRHRYDEVLAVRGSRDGQVHLLEHWPPELPPLPPGARYEPRARVIPGPVPAAARILERER